MAKKPVTVTIKGLGKARGNFQDFIKKFEKDPEIMKDIAELTTEQIKLRTRGRLDEYKQPELKKSTVARRKDLIAIGNGSEFSKPKQSNLTLSGQLLDSIAYIINNAAGKIKFYLNDPRKPYLGLSGKNLETKTNTEIKNDLETRGFRFMFISESLNARLQNRLKQIFRRRLSNFKKLSKTFK